MKLEHISLDNKKGFTLIELLIVLALFSFVIGLIYNLYSTGVFLWKNTERKLWTVQEARMSLERIIREARGAKKDTIVINPPNRTGFKFINNSNAEIGFYFEDSKIRRYVNDVAGNIIATNVDSFSVTNTGNSYKVEIKFRVKGNEYYTVSGVFTPRNK